MNDEATTMAAHNGLDPLPVDLDPRDKDERFFGELSMHLGLDADERKPLAAHLPFRGPDGLICRIETQQDGAQLVARPQLVLPLDNDEIGRLPVPRVLSLQRALMSQLGWLLGASAEGLLQLSPLRWTREAEEVAKELDMGSAVGRIVLTMLADGETTEAPMALPTAPRAAH